MSTKPSFETLMSTRSTPRRFPRGPFVPSQDTDGTEPRQPRDTLISIHPTQVRERPDSAKPSLTSISSECAGKPGDPACADGEEWRWWGMEIEVFTGGMVQTNGYLVTTAGGRLLVDAPEGVADWLREKEVAVDELWLTHQHYDHVVDVAALRRGGARVRAFAPYSDELTLEAAARAWGMPIRVEPYEVDERLDPAAGPQRLFGLEISIAHVPGHSTDSVVFHLAEQALVFSGDTLFAGSIGRTDLPAGDHKALVAGIRRHVLSLDGATRVLPGHGGGTTVAREAAGNPYL